MSQLKTIVVMPGYNAEATFQRTILDIPFNYVDEIIFVDDASTDGTINELQTFCSKNSELTDSMEVYKNNPEKILLTIHVHKKNLGYGGNQKKCYQLALDHGADIIVMLHPDYQYDPKLIKYFVEYIKDGYFDVVLGSRIRSRMETLAGGMPVYKYYSNRILSFIENMATGQNLSEWHTGMRAYKKEVLENIEYEKFSDDFVFDTQMLFSIVEKRYLIGDIPVPVRYFKGASSINFKRSFKYGIYTVFETIKFLFRKIINKKT
ncbi:MAG: glycosyltransferase family 2 protein [bacterium]